MSESLHGPGVLWVRSRISPASKSLLSESTFLAWYDDEHITEVISTTGIRSGFRYLDVNKTSPCGHPANPKPFLAFYPLEDLAFTLSDEFKNISIKSVNLPGSGVIYDFADFDVSYMSFAGATPPGVGKGGAKYVLTSGIRPEKEAGVEDFYEKQTARVSRQRGYIRTLRFKLQYARTNAQSRALKGLPAEDEPCPEPPTWIAVHEFEEMPDVEGVKRGRQISREIVGEHGEELHVWKLDRAHGDENGGRWQ